MQSQSSPFSITIANANSWPAQTPGYLPIVPGMAGWGMDQFGGSGRHAAGNTALLFIDRLTTDSAGSYDSTSRIGYGSFRWCLAQNFPRVVIPLVSGRIKFTPSSSGPYQITVKNQYLTYAGHLAPSPGLHFENVWLTSAPPLFPGPGAGQQERHHLWMHYSSFCGDDNGSDNNGTAISNCGTKAAWVNCSVMWNKDEGLYVGGSNTDEDTADQTFLHCIVAEAQGDYSQQTSHYPPSAGKGSHADYLSSRTDLNRCVFLFNRQRNPLTRCQSMSIVNCLVGQWFTSAVDPNSFALGQSRSRSQQINVVGNLFVWWPSPYSAPYFKAVHLPVRYVGGVEQGTYWLPTSTIFSPNSTHPTHGNRLLHWRSPTTSETDLMSGETTGIQPSILTGAWPNGLVPYSLGTSGGADRRVDFANLVLDGVGPRPKDRSPLLQRPIQRAKNRISGSTDDSGGAGAIGPPPSSLQEIVDLLAANPVAENSISDPFAAPAAWGGMALPNASRNTVYSSGVFSNGISRAGYTELEGFIYEQHLKLV